jgi:hypothetical protein
VLFADNDAYFQGKVNGSSVDINSSDVYESVNEGVRSGRSSYIAYHTNEEMIKTDNSGKRYKAYTRDANINNFVDRTEGEMAKNQEEE